MEAAPATGGQIVPLGDLLDYHAARDPDRPAYTIREHTLSRGELSRQANRMARALDAIGIGQGDVVSVALPTGAPFILFCFALWKLGATPNPLSVKLTERERTEILELLSPKLVIGEAPPQFQSLPGDFEPDPALSDEPFPSRISQPWKISPSGGSTGRPKLIVDHKPSLLDPANPLPLLMIRPDDVILHPAPLHHNASFTQVSWGLGWGGHAIQMTRFDPIEWMRLVAQHKVRWAYLVPTMMKRIIDLPEAERRRFDLSSLEVVMHMAAPCPAPLKAAWIEWLGPERIWEVYGGTEGLGGSLIGGVDWLRHWGSVGKPAADVLIRGPDGQALPPGEIGDIFFRTAQSGNPVYSYIGAEASTAEWQGYGDVGHVDEDGFLYLADRRTDIILCAGTNLYPAEIESVIDTHPAVAGSAVIGLPDPDMGAVPHAIIELRNGAAAPSGADLRDFLADRLAPFKLPRTFEFVEGPLRDDAGKLRRKALREERSARLAAGHAFDRIPR